MKNYSYLFGTAFLLFGLIMSGCATTGKSIALGGGIGALTGAGVGAIADPGSNGQYRTRNILIGSAIGGVVGVATGALIGDGIEGDKKESYDEGKKASEKSSASQHQAGSPPSLSNPKVEAHWIEGKVTGNRYVEPHWEYIITEPARWEDQ